MKKILLTLLATALMLPAAAQYQLTNPGFDGTWSSISPYTGGTSTSVGTTPSGWCVANVAGYKLLSIWTGKTTVGERVTGHTDYACKLTNKTTVGNVIPGYVTLGTSWNTASTSGDNSDGGAFGGASFTGTPDALEFWYQRTAENTSQPASVVAYMWKGSTTQESVPVNIASNPTKVPMTNRDRNVLGMDYALGGAVTYSSDFKLIASLMTEHEHVVKLAETTSGWTKATYEFTYHDNTTKPEKVNIVFSAADYFAERKNHKANNTLTVDDVTFLYYSELASATYDGTTVSFGGNAASVDSEYDESKLTLTSNGHGATIEKSYDASTALLSITVKGEDISVNASNYHTYTIQFAKASAPAAELSSVTVGGINVALTEGVYAYTLPFAYNPGIAVEATAVEGGTVVVDTSMGYQEAGVYNDVAKTITVSVQNAVGDVTNYVFSFTDAKSTTSIGGSYDGALSVVLGMGGDVAAMPLTNTSIVLTENQDGTMNVRLDNFSFQGALVGDIYVPALTYNSTTGKVEGTRNVRLCSELEGAMGPYLGHLPVQIDMTLSDVTNKVADASIEIITTESEIEMVSMFEQIHVDFVPFTVNEGAELEEEGMAYTYQTITGPVTKESTQFLQINNQLVETPMAYIDMSGATIASDVTAEDLKQGAPADNNTIYYVPATATQLAGTNVVVGTTAQEFSLNDKVTVNIPTAFSADKISYDRAFTAGNWSTFVSPVSVPVSAINGKVYVLSGINADAFEFTEVTGSIEANKPYLVKLDGSSIFNADAEGTVAVASETADDMTVAAGRVTQVGSYQKQQTTSDATKTWYGYTGGQFVKSNTGTINPYRTAFFVTGGSEARSFGMTIAAPTGISQAVLSIEDAPAYDLQGRRADKAEKGIYIIGGKKVILK